MAPPYLPAVLWKGKTSLADLAKRMLPRTAIVAPGEDAPFYHEMFDAYIASLEQE